MGGGNSKTEEDKPLLFKLRLLGERQVGKTSLLLQFVDEIFNDNFISTIGLDFKIKTITIQDVTMKFHIYDLPPSDDINAEFSTKPPQNDIYQADGALLIYDITDKASFKDIIHWLIAVERFGDGYPVVLVGNKSDLEGERVVSFEEGQAFAQQHNISFLETSAKTPSNVQEGFFSIAQHLLEQKMAIGGCTKRAK